MNYHISEWELLLLLFYFVILYVAKIFTFFTYIFIWVRKLDSNSLTKTKSWSGRNEVIETSGRLHPLWRQDKRLHTPRTTGYRHTLQDRWIQTELFSTLAKNATKPNPFEIILLQTTRKEKNLKTEETLERAVVTLETERIKGSNPWCLWWWWWKMFQGTYIPSDCFSIVHFF